MTLRELKGILETLEKEYSPNAEIPVVVMGTEDKEGVYARDVQGLCFSIDGDKAPADLIIVFKGE